MVVIRRIALSLDRFFFGFSAPLAVGIFRAMFSSVLLLNILLRIPYSEFYFTDAGFVPADHAVEIRPEFFQPLWCWFPTSFNAAIAVQVALCIGLLLLACGVFGKIGTRLLGIAILIGHLSLLQRNYSVMYGADFISTFWIFGLCFMNSTKRFSLARVKNETEAEWSRVLTSVGIRLVQIQLCLIYLYTGFEKLRGNDWWDQTAVWRVLGNEQLMTIDLSFLRNVPLVVGILTWGTVLFEVYAPVLLWVRSTKKGMILFGWGLHVGIAATMGLYVFSLTMMAAYLLFCEDSWLSNIFSNWQYRVKSAM